MSEEGKKMKNTPEAIATFLEGKRIAVTGVSRRKGQAANAILLRLEETGYQAFPVNPNATHVEGQVSYPDLAAIPGDLDGVVIASHPRVSLDIVRQCQERGVRQVWFHRAFGAGSVSDEAVRECDRAGIRAIVGGCPLMYCGNVDVAHRCFRWWLGRRGRAPK
jgi:uncharacterized protein